MLQCADSIVLVLQCDDDLVLVLQCADGIVLVLQCTDGSDEAGCCAKGHLRCSDGQCVPPAQLCDGKEDCPLAEDEKVTWDGHIPLKHNIRKQLNVLISTHSTSPCRASVQFL